VAAASALALLQEEELGKTKKRSLIKDSYHSKLNASSEKFRTLSDDTGPAPKSKSERIDGSDKLKELMQFRRKNGLCFKCGEGQNHTCPAQIPLHVIEELWDAIGSDDDAPLSETDDSEEIEVVMAVSSAVPTEQHKRKTMRLLGTVQGREVLILVDSGSIGTFISTSLATQLSDQLSQCPASHYTTADGNTMTCTSMVQNLQCTAQGHVFNSDARVLSLQCFDMILGPDWLEACSPMWVHWGKKLMKFTYNGKRMTLQGIRSDVPKCTAISAGKLKGLLRR